MIGSIIMLGLRSIARNKMRSFLTTLGVVIGVSSVIIMITFGRGITAKITNDISGLGSHMLIVMPGTDRRVGNAAIPPFTLNDVKALSASGVLPGALAVAPTSGAAGRVSYGNTHWNTGITGGDRRYLDVRNWKVASGRGFSISEERGASPACLLGETVKKELFGFADPLGKMIRVNKLSCKVVGILESKGQTTFGEDQDDFALIPLALFHKRISGNENVGAILVSTTSAQAARDTQLRIKAIMRQRRKLSDEDEDNFIVRDTKEISELLGSVTGALTALLGAIAAVSLIVGGIGIMNIMLVSVTERTREIGIRMAIGARAREVLIQFLIEAVVLSVFGGVIGIVVGETISLLLLNWMKLPFVFAPDVILSAFVFSALVGVFFGFYPARKASQLNPIDALRYE